MILVRAKHEFLFNEQPQIRVDDCMLLFNIPASIIVAVS